MTIIQKIQSLITAANAKTGESDATLTDAVQTLVDGYGGGGGVNPIEKTVYTHAQDWLTDNTGNTAAFRNTYFTKGAGIYYATIENNAATGNYKAITAVACMGGMTGADAYNFQRGGGNVPNADSSWSYYISAGAIVTIWFIPEGAFI